MKHRIAAFCALLVLPAVVLAVAMVFRHRPGIPPFADDSSAGVTFGTGVTGVSLLQDPGDTPSDARPFTVASQDLDAMQEGMSELLGIAEYEPNVLLVSVPESMDAREAAESLAQIEGVEIESFDSIAAGIVRVVVRGAKDAMARRMALISCADFVQAVQPSYLYTRNGESLQGERTEAEAGADSSAVPETGALSNDTFAPLQWNLQSVNVGPAWSAGTTGKGVSVAVIDGGFDVEHPDLQGQFVGPYNAVDGSSDVRGNSHGQEVAGIIAAIRGNSFVTAGVAPDARVVPVMAAVNGEYSTVTLVKAYDYVLRVCDEYGIRAINTSFGFDWKGPAVGDPLVYRMIDRAFAKGIVSVASAGNGGTTACHCPCDYANVVGVMGLEYAGFDPNTYGTFDANSVTRSESSNYNGEGETYKNVCAPGFGVPNTRDQERGDAYALTGGTSFAAPHVASTLALMWQANPELTAAQAVSALFSSATDMGDEGWDSHHGYGEVNAGEAVQYAQRGLWLEGPAFLVAGEQASYGVGNGEVLRSLRGSADAQVDCEDGAGVVVADHAGSLQLEGLSESETALRAEVHVVGPLEGPEKLVFGGAATYSVAQPYEFSYRWSTGVGMRDAVGASFSFSPVGVGTHTITAALVADPSVQLRKTVQVVPADLGDAYVAPIATQRYTGDAITPAPVVSMGNKILEEGVDYDAEYSDNVEPGAATVRIVGKGNYTGIATASFEVKT